jgi:sulfur relay (sulfurtransferase) DsrC/TusE family protein
MDTRIPATTDHPLWTPAWAEIVAQRLGLDPLAEKHWKVITLSREWFAQHGHGPDLPTLADAAGLTVAELSELFRAEPLALIRRIAGLGTIATPAADFPRHTEKTGGV